MYLSLVMHHIIMDGMSLDIIMSDLLKAYGSFQLKSEPQMPALQVQYMDFTHWQEEQLAAEAWKPQVSLTQFGHAHLIFCMPTLMYVLIVKVSNEPVFHPLHRFRIPCPRFQPVKGFGSSTLAPPNVIKSRSVCIPCNHLAWSICSA